MLTPVVDIREAGFTLVELIIALIFTLLVLAVASQVLIDSSTSNRRNQSTDTALSRATEMIESLGADLSSARSPERVPENVPTGDALRLWLLEDDATIQANLYPEFDLRDVTVATKDELWVRVDAIPEPANVVPRAECVGYRLDASGELFRIIYSNWTPCPGTGSPIESVRMLEAPPATGEAESLFTYAVMANTKPEDEPIDPANCLTKTTNSPTQTELNRIVRVQVDLRSYATTAVGSGSSKLLANLDLRMRLTRDYQYGLGCAF
jgi:type II secretory pathway pseudopilin PulG